MTMLSPSTTIVWQDEKHLHSGDLVWILTDIETFHSRYLAFSTPQELFRVGIYDVQTKRVGLARFGRDIAHAILKAGIAAPPWKAPLPVALAIHREAHESEEKGRFLVSVEPVSIEPEWYPSLPAAMRMLAQTHHSPNSTPGMWDDLAAHAALENAIEQAALRKLVPFSAADIRTAIGAPDANVTPVLQRMVRQGKLLPPTGRTRGTRYQVA